MLFFENIFLALNGLRANKIRSLLTMLGIIIGIASVIAITSVGNALTSSTMSSMSDLGATQITLGVQQRSDEKGNEDTEGLVFMDNRSRNVKEEDMMDEDMVRDIFDTFSDRLKEYRLTNSIGEGIIKSGSKEIGTRKALGATNSSIRMQFIVEAIVLCTVGGLIGVIVGVGMGYLATVIMSNMSGGGGGAIDFDIPYNGIIVALIFSASVGIFFGYYPANKAAKMNPIDALRYE